MLKYFRGKFDSGTADNDVSLDANTISRLMYHFPVGSKIQYYPEYKKNILLDSVVIAYIINDIYIYSTVNLECHGNPGVLEFDDYQGRHFTFDKIKTFKIVLPISNQSETKLDYIRREELLKVGGLVQGNVITLMAQQKSGLIPVLETVVEKRTQLRDGYYAEQMVALLEVDLASLMLSDQRAHLRLSTNIPVTIQVNKKDEYALLNCIMQDFSDRSLSLHVDNDFATEVFPEPDDAVIVSFNLPGQSEYVSLVGDVLRSESKGIVVMLSGFVEKGQVVNLGQIELLKIKANLLQHSNTHLAR